MRARGLRGPIVVVGAGPAGALTAIYLARKGCDVTVYEARPDIRRAAVPAGRSINLALATRGIVPLVDVGVIGRVDAITIPMRGRMIHAGDSSPPALQPYGTHAHEVIHSVSRRGLNAILLDAAEVTGRVDISFESSVRAVDLRAGTLAVAGPDGARTHRAVRHPLRRRRGRFGGPPGRRRRQRGHCRGQLAGPQLQGVGDTPRRRRWLPARPPRTAHLATAGVDADRSRQP
ncbi:MAG: FAD-dependent oxidoreductase [Acidimicrobiia bacterium]|nr:FAD-dependent oxidoreductase [Acidimicrobiia bacterium]